jgi:hypothetical protein
VRCREGELASRVESEEITDGMVVWIQIEGKREEDNVARKPKEDVQG